MIIVPDLATGITVNTGRWTWERYALIDRGSYEVAHGMDEPLLVERAEAAATRAMGRELRVREKRAVRLSPGDYVLARHDRVYDDYPVELMFDLSRHPIEGAEVHYRRRGRAFFRFPSQPGAASIVERGPTVTCNHTYVSKLHPGAIVTRLVMLLW